MEKTPHQVLCSEEQEKLDKEKIQDLLVKHNLDENVDLIYKIMKKCANGEEIDDNVKKIVSEFDGEEEETDLVDYYLRRFKKNNEEKVH